MSSPQLFPINLDNRRHLVSFVRMSRRGYRNMSFLDPRASPMGPDLYTVNFDDLLLYDANSIHRSAPIHYVLHTALCCSTLLARYFDLISSCLVLREPNMLAQIAIRRPFGLAEAGTNNGQHIHKGVEEWQQQLSICLKLLGRTYTANEVVVIKVNDACNFIGDVLLSNDARSKIVFLYVEIRTFLLSVLKSQRRRTWLRRRLADNRKAAQAVPLLSAIDTASLSDAERGAYLWLINSAICDRLRTGLDSERVLPLDGERVAEAPKETLRIVGDFLGLPLEEPQLEKMLVHPSISRYSKDLSQTYNVNSRRNEAKTLEAQFGDEVEQGIEWARRIKNELQFSPA